MAKKVVEKPLSLVTSTLSRYKEAIELQIEGFWKRNYLFVVGAGGVLVCILLWRIMFGIANTFVGLSEGMAKYGFLALSSAIVAFTVSPLHMCPFFFSIPLLNCIARISMACHLWCVAFSWKL